jgi:hypothetical protein
VGVFLLAQGLALVAFWFVPTGGWTHAIWQTVAMAISVAFMLVGVRRLRPEASVAWYLIGAGVFLNGCGVTADLMGVRLFGVTGSPNAADVFWSALFPGAAIGLGMLVRRAAAREEPGSALRNTVICVPIIFFTSIYAWQFVAWRSSYAERIPLAYKILVTAYPFGDLVFAAMLLRLLLSIGPRNVSLRLMLGWLLLLFPSDLGWPMYARSGTEPGRAMQYFMEATWTGACALLAAATWHPDVREIARAVEGRVPALGTLRWFGLAACVLVGPLVVLFQVMLDRFYSLTTF